MTTNRPMIIFAKAFDENGIPSQCQSLAVSGPLRIVLTCNPGRAIRAVGASSTITLRSAQRFYGLPYS
jgi:hypothetical protein